MFVSFPSLSLLLPFFIHFGELVLVRGYISTLFGVCLILMDSCERDAKAICLYGIIKEESNICKACVQYYL